MPDDEKKTPLASKEGEPKPADPTEPPILIVDTTDQLPEGFGVMIIGGVAEPMMKKYGKLPRSGQVEIETFVRKGEGMTAMPQIVVKGVNSD